MNRRISIILMCALLIASMASYAVYRMAARQQPSAPPKPVALAHVVVAARNPEAGALVHPGDLVVAGWPGVPPKGALLRKTDALDRGVVSAIYEGEPVMENRLAGAGSGGGLAITIPPGMRACAVRVNDVVGVGGFAVPGMRVDVLMAGVPPGATGAEMAVRTLLQNIEVLSAGVNFEKDKEGKPQQAPVVNLLVTPHQAEMLSLAGNETKIQLVLRNPADTQVAPSPGSSTTELFSGIRTRVPSPASVPRVTVVAPVPTPAPANPPEIIEILNGATRTTSTFHSAGESQ